MQEVGYIAYIHKNKTNNKIYVGITSQKPKQRWRNGTNYYGNVYFTRAIRKYGWDGFEHIIIATDLTRQEAENMEIELIKKYSSDLRDFGYNIEHGGSVGGKHSEETKRKISESQKGEKNHMYGKRGELNPHSKKVVCLNDFTIYNSVKEASLDKNTNNAISSACNGKRKSCGKDNVTNEALLWIWYEDFINMTKDEIQEYIADKKKKFDYSGSRLDTTYSNNNNAKKIICLNTKESFNCIKEACEKYEISPSTLSQCLIGNINGCKSKKFGISLTFVYFEEYKNMTEIKIKQKIKRCEKRIGRSKKVLFIEENKIFDSTREMCEYLRQTLNEVFTELYIRKVCKGIMDNYKGYHFSYV